MDRLVLSTCSKASISKNLAGEPIEGCYEGMTFSEMSKVIAAFTNLHDWRAACLQHNCSAGKMLTITGNESNMSVTQYYLGPFTWLMLRVVSKTMTIIDRDRQCFVEFLCTAISITVWESNWSIEYSPSVSSGGDLGQSHPHPTLGKVWWQLSIFLILASSAFSDFTQNLYIIMCMSQGLNEMYM